MDALLDETLSGTIQPLAAEASDRSAWDDWGRHHFGRSWLDVPFLWAESYFYRRLLQAVGFFTPGPWLGLDPFSFLKTAELCSPALEVDLAGLAALTRLNVHEKTRVLVGASLWGNQADLGFRIGVDAVSGQLGPSAHVVADETTAAVSILGEGVTSVCVVADNAGRELLSDLILIDHLLDAGLAARVVLHLKPQPYYVSDATGGDLVGCLRRLAAGPPPASSMAARLHAAVLERRLEIATHWFYCAPFSFHQMPSDLAAAFDAASVVVLKGDLNYRRLVGDWHWPETTPFAEATSYFPAPVIALRTLKSDVVVGLQSASVTALDMDVKTDGWRINGRYALVQVRT